MQHVPWLRIGLTFFIAPVLQGFTASALMCSCNCLTLGPLSLEDPTVRHLHERIVFVPGRQESSQAWLAKTYKLAFLFTSPAQSQRGQQRGSTSVPDVLQNRTHLLLWQIWLPSGEIQGEFSRAFSALSSALTRENSGPKSCAMSAGTNG